MPSTPIARPALSEHSPYYSRYIDLVPEGDVLDLMGEQLNDTLELLDGLDETRASHRYAPDKWSIKEVVQHVIDTERVFSYRALRFSRNDSTPLPGFDENSFAANAGAHERPLEDLARELRLVRLATIALYDSLTPDATARIGIANETPCSVRALAYITAGHERHHVRILRERYLGEPAT
jgi:hypothetical protein